MPVEPPRDSRRSRSGPPDPPPAAPRRDPLNDPSLRRPSWALPAEERQRPPAAGLPPLPPATPRRAPTPPSPGPTGPAITPTSRGQDVTAGRPRATARPTTRRRLPQRPVSRVAAVVAAIVLVLACAWLLPLLFKGQQLVSDIFVPPGPRPTVEGVPSNFPNWDKKERVNILLMGLDTREENNTRSDTLILVSIDPANKTVGMMSIPRDLWVQIPGYGENRINAAYQFGLSDGVPGGGPGLVEATVEQNLGIPVHYFAEIDFQGFVRVVDALDGIVVDVPRPLLDNEYPAENFAFMRIYIPSGLQQMDGRTALQYVRSRHADSDLSRNQRQQGVLLALKQKGLQLNIITKLDNLLTQLQGAVKTDLSLSQAGSLGQLAQQIPAGSIRSYSITADMTSPGNVNGAEVLIPDWAQIRAQVRAMMSDSRLENEAARILVLNGTETAGLAGRTRDRLAAAGLSVADVGQAPNTGNYPRTQLLDYTGGEKPATVEKLRKELSLESNQVRAGLAADRPANIDLVLIVGDDAVP
jgi:LCP family protein required for cell wall assembly